MGVAEMAEVLELYGYQLHRRSEDGVVWSGECVAPNGECICRCTGPDRHAVNDTLTDAAFKHWVAH